MIRIGQAPNIITGFPLSNVTEDNIEMFYKENMEYALLRKTDGECRY